MHEAERKAIERQDPVGSEQGATAVEYMIIGSLIAAVIVALVVLLGEEVLDLFDTVAGKF